METQTHLLGDLMKNLKLALIALTSALVLSSAAFAEGTCVDAKGNDITNQPEVFQRLIEQSKSCYEAKQLAEACAWGSSLDVQTVGVAYGVCDKELKAQKPARSLLALESKMESICNKKYENEQGTMYRSMNAYCNLSALAWILDIATPN